MVESFLNPCFCVEFPYFGWSTLGVSQHGVYPLYDINHQNLVVPYIISLVYIPILVGYTSPSLSQNGDIIARIYNPARCYIPIYNSWSNGPIYSALCLTSPRISQVDVPLWRPLPASSAVVRRERLVREARLHSLPLSKFFAINRVTPSKDNSMVPHVPRFSLADVMRLFFFLIGCKVVGHGPTFVKLQVLRCGRCALNNTREEETEHTCYNGGTPSRMKRARKE